MTYGELAYEYSQAEDELKKYINALERLSKIVDDQFKRLNDQQKLLKQHVDTIDALVNKHKETIRGNEWEIVRLRCLLDKPNNPPCLSSTGATIDG